MFEGGVFVIVDVPEDKGLAEVFFEEIFFLEEFEEDVEGVEEFGLVERVGIFFHSWFDVEIDPFGKVHFLAVDPLLEEKYCLVLDVELFGGRQALANFLVEVDELL